MVASQVRGAFTKEHIPTSQQNQKQEQQKKMREFLE